MSGPRKATSTTEERHARREQLRQQQLPRAEFSARQCLLCGGGAEPISSTQLPAILGRVGGSVSYQELVRLARREGFGPDHCYTSAAGVSICKSEKPR